LNLALAYDRMDHAKQAYAWYNVYLAAAPDADNRVKVEARLKQLETKLRETMATLYKQAEAMLPEVEKYYASGDPGFLAGPNDYSEVRDHEMDSSREFGDFGRACAYLSLASAAAYTGDLKKAEYYAERIRSCPNQIMWKAENAYVWIGYALADECRVELVNELVRKHLPSPKDQLPVYGQLIEILLVNERYGEARTVFEKWDKLCQGMFAKWTPYEKQSYYLNRSNYLLGMRDLEAGRKSILKMSPCEARDEFEAMLAQCEKDINYLQTPGGLQNIALNYRANSYADLAAHLASLKAENKKPNDVIDGIWQPIPDMIYVLSHFKKPAQ
jgi:hypothetical protein